MQEKDQSKITDREQFELQLNSLLQAWQASIAKGPPWQIRNQLQKDFFSALFALPFAYKTIVLHVQLNGDDSNTPSIKEDLEEKLRVQEENNEGNQFRVPILVPRQPALSGITGSHGSAHRRQFFQYGEIATIRDGFQIRTRAPDGTMLDINPARIGGLSTDDAFGRYFISPLEILGTELQEALPNYLTEDDAAFVNRFYQNLQGENRETP